jgi:hypothetical protein
MAMVMVREQKVQGAMGYDNDPDAEFDPESEKEKPDNQDDVRIRMLNSTPNP